MSTTILAMLLLNGADLDVLGHALAPQAHGLDSFCYRVPGPPLDTVIEDASESITLASGAPPSGFSPTWAPASLLDLVEDQRPRFAVGAPVDAPEKQARNEAVIAALPRVEVPARAPIAIICVARRVAQNEVMRELVVDWAIPVERAAQLARDRLSPCQFEFAEFLAMGHELTSDPRGCTAAWGAESDKLDANERAVVLAEERAREAEENRRRAWSVMNTVTCEERGVFVVTKSKHETHLGPLTGAADAGGWNFHGGADRPYTDENGTTYHIFDASRLAGLRLGPHPRILEGDAVPPIPVRYFERKTQVNFPVMQYLLREVRRDSVDDAPVTAFRDARTADGRIMGERIVALWKPLAELLCTEEGKRWKEAFVQSWIRSCLPRDGGYAAYVEVISDAWHRLHAPTNLVLQPARTVYVDEYGAEWPEFQIVKMVGGQICTNGGEFFFEGRPTPLVPKKLPAVMWKAPPLPMSESTYLDLATRAMQGGEHALVGLNELVEEIEPGFLETFKARFLPDPWRPVLEAFVEGKPHVFASELEEALRAAGEIKEEVFPTKGFGRIGRIMTKLGWEQKQIPLNGRRPKVWIRANDGGAK